MSRIESLESRQLLAGDTYTVTTLTDVAVAGTTTDNLWSLREALAHSAADAQSGEDVIQFAGLTGVIDLDPAIGQLPVSRHVQVIGPGANQLTVAANGNHRVFQVSSGATATLSGLTITGGGNVSEGGGVLNAGNLTLQSVVIAGNTATNLGGGVQSVDWVGGTASLRIIDSTIDGNRAVGGSGVNAFVFPGRVLEVVGSTISNNFGLGIETPTYSAGGGLSIGGYATGTVTIANSTVSGNKALYSGGIRLQNNLAPTTIVNSTIVNNTGNESGGLQRLANTVAPKLHNTIVAENKNHAGARIDVAGALDVSSSYNIFGAGRGSAALTGAGNQVGTSGTPVDPKLAPLGDYGGPTATHALRPNSPAVNAGNNVVAAALDSDQRGGPRTIAQRIVGGVVDIGAFEYGAVVIDVESSEELIGVNPDAPFHLYADPESESQSKPWVATNSLGQSVVVWLGEGPEGDGVYMQLVSSADGISVPRLVDVGHPVESWTSLQAAIDDQGAIAIVWRSNVSPNASDFFIRRYRPNGSPIDSMPVNVSGGTAKQYVSPSLVSNGAGQLIVSWQSQNGDLLFRRFTTSGLTLDNAPRTGVVANGIDIYIASSRRSVAIAENGDFHLVYTVGSESIRSQRFDAGGAWIGESDVVALATDDSFLNGIDPQDVQSRYIYAHDVAIDRHGNLVVTWLQTFDMPLPPEYLYGSTAEYRLQMRQRDTESGWTASRLVAESDGLYGALPNNGARVSSIDLQNTGLAIDDFGRIGVAWLQMIIEVDSNGVQDVGQGFWQDIVVRWFDDESVIGTAVVGRFDSNEINVYSPAMSVDAGGRFLVVGAAGDQILARRYSLPQPISLDAGGILRINDEVGEFDDLSLRSVLVGQKEYVVFNDVITDIEAADVTGVIITAGPNGNNIDLTRVRPAVFAALTAGSIEVFGGAGDDVIFASPIGDVIHGGSDADRIFGNDGNDTINGDEGDDVLSGFKGDDLLRGGADQDTLLGGLGSDLLEGNDGDDILQGEGGNDALIGGAGDDQLDGGEGALDALDGGSGNDVFFLSERSALQTFLWDNDGEDAIDLSRATVAATLTLSGVGIVFKPSPSPTEDRQLTIAVGDVIENVIGTPYDDLIIGNDANNRLIGGHGNDTVSGGAGDDLLQGGAGNDTLDGGLGNDVLEGGTGNDSLRASDGIDQFVGGFGDDVYFVSNATPADVSLFDVEGIDTLDFSEWDEAVSIDLSQTASIEEYQLLAPDIRLLNSGLRSVERIIGTDFSDDLIGHSGDNEIFGGDGADLIDGRGGSDFVLGQGGMDRPEIADNGGGPEYAETGVGWTSTDYGFNRGQRKASAGTATTVTWNFNDLAAGEYEVYVSWAVDPAAPASGATAAKFQVVSGVVTASANSINQSVAPDGPLAAGTRWQRLIAGSDVYFDVTDGTLSVRLNGSTSSGGAIYADAVRIVKRIPPPTINESYTGSAPIISSISDQSVNEGGTLTFDFIVTDADAYDDQNSLRFDFGLRAPAGLKAEDVIAFVPGGTSNPNQYKFHFSWTPGELHDGVHDLQLRVADGSVKPLRSTERFAIEVVEINSPPAIVPGSFKVKYDTGQNDDDGETADVLLVGEVTDPEDVSFLEVELDFGYDGIVFRVDEVVAVTPNDFDSTTGTFQIRLFDSQLTLGSLNVAAARIREWTGSSYIPAPNEVTIEQVTFTPSLAAVQPPVVMLSLKNDTGAADGMTIDPTLVGTVTSQLSTEGLVVKIYATPNNVWPSPSDPLPIFVGETTADAFGEFEFVPPGLANGSYHLWAIAELPLSVSATPILSDEVLKSFTLVENNAPQLIPTSLRLKTDSGESGSDRISNDVTIEGQLIAEEHQRIDGIFVEFDHDFDPNNPATFTVDGVAMTDSEGRFIYLPPGLAPSATQISLGVRPVEWDKYREQRLLGTPQQLEFTYTHEAGANRQAVVNQLELKFQPIEDGIANPTVRGAIDNDGAVEGVLIEFAVNDPTFQDVHGFALTDDFGEFEFTPMGLNYGANYTIYARAVEWDADRGISLTQATPYQLTDGEGDPLSFTLSDQPLSLNALVDFRLAYDTGQQGDFATANPTVTGEVDYAGEMSGVVVEFDWDGDVSTIEGTVTPNEDGSFTYTPSGLSPGAFVISVRVRVPDYGVRLPEYENSLLTSGVDGELLDDWYRTGYVNGWVDADADGVPDANEQWLAEIYASDGVSLTGEWFNSSFERDWTEVLADQTTSWQTLGASEEIVPVLDLGENNAPLAPTIDFNVGSASNPTIQGMLEDDGLTAGVLIEFYLNGSTIPDGSIVTDADGAFVYTFRHPTNGENDFEIRVYESVYEGEPAVHEFSLPSYSFSLVTDDALAPPTLGLPHDVGTSGNREARDSTLAGSLPFSSDAGMRRIQFDYDGDDRPDAEVLSDADGTFEFAPTGLSQFLTGPLLNQASVRARLLGEGNDLLSESKYSTFGPWSSPLVWTVLANSPPAITRFELELDSGLQGLGYEVLDRITSDATLVGCVENDNGVAFLTVEFDHDGDGIVDGSVLTDENGHFRYVPQGLSEGLWDIRARVQETSTTSGDVLVDPLNPWKSITATGDPTVISSSLGFTLKAPTPAVMGSLVPLDSSPFRNDPTLTGVVTDVDTTANLVIEFFLEGSDEVIGTTSVNDDGTFQFTPVGLEFSETHRIQARPRELNYLTGQPLYGADSSVVELSFEPYYNGFGVSGFNNESTQSDVELALIGTVDVPTVYVGNEELNAIAVVYIEIGQLDGSNELIQSSVTKVAVQASPVEVAHPSIPGATITELRYEFRYEPNLPSPTSDVKFVARSVGIGENGYVFGPWSSVVNVVYDAKLPIIDWSQEQDEQEAPIPTSNVIEGQIEWTDGGNTISGAGQVEIDVDGDGVVDDVVVTEEGGSFRYEFARATPGTLTVRARAVRYHVYQELASDGQNVDLTENVVGQWQVISFVIANPAPSVSQLALVEPSLDNEGQPLPTESESPTIKGVVSSDVADDVAGMTVEVDHNGDGVADGTTIVSADGSFEYAVNGASPGAVAIRIRAVDAVSGAKTLVGSWTPYEFTLREIAAPTVNSLSLPVNENASGGQAVSSNPILVGNISFPATAVRWYVEFDHDSESQPGFGVVDGTAVVDQFGNFRYSPQNLPHGNVTIRARAVAQVGTQVLTGPWRGIGINGAADSFYHRSIEAAVVSQLTVLDQKTAKISGRATVGGFGGALWVNVRVVGSAAPEHDFTLPTDANGYFELIVPQLAAGTHNLEVRGVSRDPATGNDVLGPESTLSLTYAPDAVTLPSLDEFLLAHNTGNDQDANVTADPTLRGRLTSAHPQLYVQFDYTLGNGEDIDATVAVAADGSFTHTPDGLANNSSHNIVVRMKLWDPIQDEYIYSQWFEADAVPFSLDQTENATASIDELTLWQNAAPNGQTPQSAAPIFAGKVADADGIFSGKIVEFDHNGDGVIDGRTNVLEDGSFLYEATGLEPSLTSQTITAHVIEQDYWGIEYASAAESLTFILTEAPLIHGLTHQSSAVAGSVYTSLPPGTLHIEYQLFGDGVRPNPPVLSNDPATWEGFDPAALLTTAIASGGFTIDVSALNAGPATILVRATDGSGTTGPWQALSFTVGGESASPLTITAFGLLFPKDPGEAADPTVSGTLDAGGAFGVVEIKVTDVTDPQNPSHSTHRTTADKNGVFRFTPPQLLIGHSYEIQATSVVLNAATLQEAFGTPSTTSLLLLANDKVTVVIDHQPSASDPTVGGYVVNDGRIAGLRLEYDVNGGVGGVAVTDQDGRFSFTPYGLMQGVATTVRIRAQEWDPVAHEFVVPAWTDAEVATAVQFTPAADGPSGPGIEENADGGLTAVDISQEGMRDAVFSLLGDLGVTGAGDQLNLGIGSMQLLHKGGAGDSSAEQELTDHVFQVAGGSINNLSDVRGATNYNVATDGGGSLTVDYSIERSVQLIGDTFEVITSVYVTLDNYFDENVASGSTSSLGLSGTYYFHFSAGGSLNLDGTINSGTYDLTESVNFEYLHTETIVSPGGGSTSTRTSAGDYTLTRNEGQSTAGTFTRFVATQPFTQVETVRMETWFEDSGSDSSEADGRYTSRDYETSEHSLYERTTTVTGGVIEIDAGIQTANATITVEASIRVDRQHSEETSYHNSYAGGNYEQGSDSVAETSFYEASLFLETTNHSDGVSSTQRFTVTESEQNTRSVSGSGSAVSNSGNNDYSESWDYSGASTSGGNSSSSGVLAQVVSSGGTISTLNASGVSSGRLNSSGTASGSVTFSNSSDASSSSGSGNSSMSFETTVSVSGTAVISRVNDVYRLTGSTSAATSASANLRSSSNGSSTSTSGDATTTVTSSSSQRASANRSADANTNYEETDRGSKVSGTGNTSLSLSSSSAAQAVGSTTDGGETTIFRSSEAGSYALAVKSNVRFLNDRSSPGVNVRTASGNGSRNESTSGKSSNYVGSSDGFSLTNGTSSRKTRESFDFDDDNGSVTRRGTFSKEERGSSDTLSQFSTTSDDGKTKAFARSDASGTSQKNLKGTFAEDEDGSQGLAAVSEMQTSSGASKVTVTTKDSSAGHRSSSTATLDSSGMAVSGSAGIIGLADGELTFSYGIGTQFSTGRSNLSGSSFSEDTSSSAGVTTRTSSASNGSTRSSSVYTGSALYSGVEEVTVNAIGTSNESGSFSSSGRQTSDVKTNAGGEQRKERVVASGSSRGSQNSTGSGFMKQGPLGNTSMVFANAQQSGTSNGRTTSTVDVSDEFTRSHSTATATDKSSSSQRFNGTISEDEEHRTSENGTFNSASNGEADVDSSYRENSSGAGFKSFVVSSGKSGGEIDVTTDGSLTADHDKARREGRTTAKNSGDEDTTTTTGGSSFTFTGDGFIWETSTTKYETGGDESSDSSGSFESEEDRSDDDEPVESESDESEEDEEEGESNWKVTGRDKVTFDNTRILVQLNGISVHTRHEESTVKTSVDEENSREQLTETWSEDLRAVSNPPSGNVVTVTVDEDGKATKTFTTAGNDPGDLQSLKITRKIDRTDKTHTNYADEAISSYGFNDSMDESGFGLVADQSTYTTVLDEDTSYKASHTLGADGVSAVGGTVKASHKRKVTSTSDSSGSTSDAESSATTRVDKFVSESQTTQNEQSTYEDTPNGRKIGGGARSVLRETIKREVDASSEFDADRIGFTWSGNSDVKVNNWYTTVKTTTDSFGEKSSQTYKESFTSRTSEKHNEYNRIDWDAGGSESANSHKKYSDRIHINPDGDNSRHSADLHFWGTGDHWAGAEPIDPPPGYTFPEWDTYEVKWNDDAPTYADHWDARAHYNANDPPEGKKHDVHGGATPDPGRVSAAINFRHSSASWWNPIDLGYRLLYTGDAFAPDSDYAAATDGGGENYNANKAAAHQAVDAASVIDPTPLSDAVNATLYSIEGDFENAKSTAKWAAAGPVGDVIRLARNAKKGLGAAQQLGEQLGKNSDKADDVVQFGDGVVSKAPKIDDPVLEQMRIENKAQQAKILDTSAKFPENPGQIRHIFRDAPGHLADTPANRSLLKSLADDATASAGVDRFGNVWRSRINPDGSQIWVQLRDGIIQNGGINPIPRTFNP